MDDMSDWQLEEAARRAQDILSLAEGSGVLDSARVAAQIIEASGIAAQVEEVRATVTSTVSANVAAAIAKMVADATPQVDMDSVLAALMGTVEIVKMIDTLTAGMSFHIQATYAQMIAGLVGLRRQYAGAGASFELTWGEGSGDDDVQERRLVVPAADAFTLGEDATAEVIHGSASTTLDDVTGSATGQVVVLETLHLGIGLGVMTVDSSLTTLIGDTTLPDWTIARKQDSKGVYELLFRAKGGAAIARLNDVESVGLAIMRGELDSRPTYPALPSRRPAGRKPDLENNIAYSLIVEGGNTEESVDRAFEYWYTAKSIKNPTQGDRNNFNLSMKRAAERAGRQSLRTD